MLCFIEKKRMVYTLLIFWKTNLVIAILRCPLLSMSVIRRMYILDYLMWLTVATHKFPAYVWLIRLSDASIDIVPLLHLVNSKLILVKYQLANNHFFSLCVMYWAKYLYVCFSTRFQSRHGSTTCPIQNCSI